MAYNDILLSIKNLSVDFSTDQCTITAVNEVSYDIYQGRTLAVVGESGCGKTVTALSIMRLIPDPPGRIVQGEILFRSQNLLSFTEKRMRSIRGNEIAMIFQEPMTSLNPVLTVGEQIMETVHLHQRKKGQTLRNHAIDMLRLVGIPDPQRCIDEFPHQLSGGMRQRIMIAMALSCDPTLLIADEPTTALDVTIQAQILELIRQLQRRNHMSVLLITHDLGVVAENADDVAIMYASKIIEKTSVKEIFAQPRHPYTMGLLNSLPRLGETRERLEVIPGVVPDPAQFPTGCKFHPRCRFYTPEDLKCRTQEPVMIEIEPDHWCACWKAKVILNNLQTHDSTAGDTEV